MDRLAAGPDVLFCYGTLRFDAVLEALLGRIPARIPASLPGWRAAALEGRVYPGLVVSAPNDTVDGIVLTDLNSREWKILDAFEDVRYELSTVIEMPRWVAVGCPGWWPSETQVCGQWCSWGWGSVQGDHSLPGEGLGEAV
ncbi:gamma-glutamylcyclotransferase family protein [Streptomyces sp. NPDC002611]